MKKRMYRFFKRPCKSALLMACFSSSLALAATAESEKSTSLFTEVSDLIPIEKRERRKWDSPMIADLDGNGFQDIVLTEHAHKVQIFWNEGGTFSGPQDLISGDMHGQGLGDFDNDGQLEIIVAQGGGNGSNPRKPVHFEVGRDRSVSKASILSHFEKGRGRSIKPFDGDNDGDLDLFLTGFFTPEQKFKGANHLYRNDGKGNLEFVQHLPFSDRLSYLSTTTDFNGDGDADILVFGGNRLVALEGGEGLTFTEVTEARFGNLKSINDISAISSIDFDRDGDLDLVLSRSEHQFENETYLDQENQRYAFFSRFSSLQLDDLKIDGDLTLENLQMAYPHFDVFAGKARKRLKIESREQSQRSWDADSYGLLDVVVSAQEAAGFPDNACAPGVKIKDLPEDSPPGLYVGYMGEGVWRICNQTLSPTAAVIHNVRSNPSTTSDEALPAKLLENRDGKFVDVTEAMGIRIGEQTTVALVVDLNNDGWDDLYFNRYGNMAMENQQIVYLNQQGQTFQRLESHGVVATERGATGSGAAKIDFDKDGDYDILTANERGLWHLFKNNTESLNGHYFIGFTLGASPSGKASVLGAAAEVRACGNTWRQVVGDSASSYGVPVNNDLLFGLGQCDKVDTVSIRWSNGETQVVKGYEVNRYNDTRH